MIDTLKCAARNVWLLVILSVSWGMIATPVSAACFREGVLCHEDFDSFNAVAVAGDGFVLAGQIKSGSASGVALMRMSRDAEVRHIVPLDWPPSIKTESSPVAEPKRLLSLSNGTIILLGNVQLRGTPVRNVGWVAGLGSDGRVWHRILSDESADIFLYGAHYDARAERIIVVGKRQAGADDGRCSNWSQSYVQGLKPADGRMTAPSVLHGLQQSGQRNRQGLHDIVAGEAAGTFVVAGFVSGPKAGGGCQDDMLVGTLSEPEAGRWTLAPVQRLGAGTGDDIAFAIKPVGRGRYLLAGHGQDLSTGAKAAQVLSIRLSPFAVNESRTFPFPDSDADRDGGDRFRAAIPVANATRFVLAGSVSTGARGANMAMWRTASADLRQIDRPVIFDGPGASDILDGVTLRDGRVLVVGRATDRTGARMGWFGFVGSPSIAEGIAQPAVSPGRTQPLVRLTSLPQSGGIYHLPETATSSPSGYLHDQVARGSQLDLVLSVRGPQPMWISSRAATGDVDLVVTDASGRLVTFSNYKGVATELVIVKPQAEQYTVSLIAQSALTNLEFWIGPAQDIGVPTLTRLQALSAEQRTKLSEQLGASGYWPGSEPGIGMGGETVRAVLAAQSSSASAFGPVGIGGALASQVGTRDESRPSRTTNVPRQTR